MATSPVTPQSWHIELKKVRKSQRMSQRDMESRTGIRQSHLSRIENGLADPKLSQAIQMARAVGFELVLVPRRALPGVSGLLREFESRTKEGRRPTAVELLVGDGGDA